MSGITDSVTYPKGSSFLEEDWLALASLWHPVAASDEVSDGPYCTTLMDQRIVLFRTSAGVTAAFDQCPHRGAKLSDGWVKDENLVCPYHGLSYGADGKCTFIPAEGKGKGIADKLCLHTLSVEERFGIIWASFSKQPSIPLPDWSVLLSEKVVSGQLPPEEWEVTAARHAENFNDVAHISWVHTDTFGALPHDVQNYKLERHETGLRHYYHDTGNTQLFERHRTGDQIKDLAKPIENVLFDYRFTYPFASMLEISEPAGRSSFVFDAIQPVSSDSSRIYKIVARNFDLDGPVDGAIQFEQSVNREDKAIMEGMIPGTFSFSPSDDVPIRADKWSIAYRRGMVGLGIGRSK